MTIFRSLKDKTVMMFNGFFVSTKEERRRENIRKAFHSLGIIIPFVILFFEQKTIIILLVVATVLLLIADYNNFFLLLKKNSFLNKFIFLFRDEELVKGKLTGLSWLLIGMLITVVAFDKQLVALSFAVLIFGDAFAALIGKNFGRIKLCGSKTFEGSLAFIISSFVVSYFFIKHLSQLMSLLQLIAFKTVTTATTTLNMTYVCIAILFSSIAELVAKNIEIDDNFAIPVTFCTVYMIMTILF